MANVNSSIGYFDVPTQTITVNTRSPLLVPAFSYNSGFPLPSPAIAAGSNLYVQVPPDVATGSANWDGHPFRVRCSGKYFTGGSYTFNVGYYLGATGTTSLAVAAVSNAVTGANNFTYEATIVWDSTSQILNGTTSALLGGTIQAATAFTAQTSIAMSGLIFVPTFTFGTANAANTVTVTELLIERV